MKIFVCVILLALALPPLAYSKSLSDVKIMKEVPPLPQDLEKWQDSHKVAVRSAGCRNIAYDCHCNFWKMLGLCESQNYHVWMKKQCAASCGICVAEASDCQNKYGDETCKKFTDHRFHLMPQFQYFMACSCAKASGICTTALATPAPTLQAIDDEDEECLRLQNEKRSQHGAAPLVWCQECADFAKTVVQTMQDLNEPLHHTSPEERTWLVEGKEVLHGSNLQYEFPHVDCAIAVESWYSETEFYDPDRPVESLEQAGHFTQMVWKDTKSVGCAWTENYLACIYEPTGNTENAYDIERNVQP